MATSMIARCAQAHTPCVRACRAVPCRAVPCRAVPCRAVPCRAVQSSACGILGGELLRLLVGGEGLVAVALAGGLLQLLLLLLAPVRERVERGHLCRGEREKRAVEVGHYSTHIFLTHF